MEHGKNWTGWWLQFKSLLNNCITQFTIVPLWVQVFCGVLNLNQALDHPKWSRIGGDMAKTISEAPRWSLAKYIHICT
jgi:hypothetical protein